MIHQVTFTLVLTSVLVSTSHSTAQVGDFSADTADRCQSTLLGDKFLRKFPLKGVKSDILFSAPANRRNVFAMLLNQEYIQTNWPTSLETPELKQDINC